MTSYKKALLLTSVLWISGCATWPETFEGSMWSGAEIRHKESQIKFPYNILRFTRDNHTIRGTSPESVSVAYEWPKLFTRASYQAGIVVFMADQTTTQSADDLLKNFRANGVINLESEDVFGCRVQSFESKDVQSLAVAMDVYDSYRQLWLCDFQVWKVKFVLVSSLGEKENAKKTFQDFVQSFLDQQRN